MEAKELWKELHHLFDTDDGSLPEIWLSDLSPDGVVAIFAHLQNASDRIMSGSSLWVIEEQQDKPVNSVPNAASLVVQGLAEPFHCLCQGLTCNGAVIPDLGVFVLENQIVLDYRMGEEWNAQKLNALFGLLTELKRIHPTAKVSIEESALKNVRNHFEETWERFFRSINDV